MFSPILGEIFYSNTYICISQQELMDLAHNILPNNCWCLTKYWSSEKHWPIMMRCYLGVRGQPRSFRDSIDTISYRHSFTYVSHYAMRINSPIESLQSKLHNLYFFIFGSYDRVCVMASLTHMSNALGQKCLRKRWLNPSRTSSKKTV